MRRININDKECTILSSLSGAQIESLANCMQDMQKESYESKNTFSFAMQNKRDIKRQEKLVQRVVEVKTAMEKLSPSSVPWMQHYKSLKKLTKEIKKSPSLSK